MNKIKYFIYVTILCSLFSNNALAANDIFVKCDDCSSSYMFNTAQQQAVVLGNTVHVVSTTNRVVRSYHAEILEEFDFVPPLIDNYTFEISTDLTVLNDINMVLDIAEEIELLSVTGINSSIFTNTPGIADSALDIPGSWAAGQRIQNAISDYLAGVTSNQSTIDSAAQAVRSMFGNLTNSHGTHITITFPDGSVYTYIFDGVTVDSNGNFRFNTHAELGSGRDMNDNPIPENQANLANMSANIGGGSAADWLDLISRISGGYFNGQQTIVHCTVEANVMTCTAVQIKWSKK